MWLYLSSYSLQIFTNLPNKAPSNMNILKKYDPTGTINAAYTVKEWILTNGEWGNSQ